MKKLIILLGLLFSITNAVTFKEIMAMPETDYAVLGHSIVILSSVKNLSKQELDQFYDLVDGSKYKHTGFMSGNPPKYDIAGLDVLLDKSGFKDKLTIYNATTDEAYKANSRETQMFVDIVWNAVYYLGGLFIFLVIMRVSYYYFKRWLSGAGGL